MSDQEDENQNLIDGTPLYTFVCTVQERIKEALGNNNARFGQSSYADVNLHNSEIKSIYEAQAIEEVQSQNIEIPPFLLHGFKTYLDKTLIKNITVTLPFDNGPSTLYIHESQDSHYLGYGGSVVYFPVNCEDLDNKKAYLLAVIMPLIQVKPEKKSTMQNLMTLSLPTRKLHEGLLQEGFHYSIAIHGFYAENNQDLLTEIQKTVNYCICSPNENYGRHSINSIPSAADIVKLDIDKTVKFLSTLNLFKGTPLTSFSLTNPEAVSNEDYALHMERYEKVKDKFVYKPESIKCYRSATTQIQPIIFDAITQ